MGVGGVCSFAACCDLRDRLYGESLSRPQTPQVWLAPAGRPFQNSFRSVFPARSNYPRCYRLTWPGIDVGIQSVYRLYKHTFFELMSSWLEAVPGRTVELRMFAQGLTMTDEPANIKAIMSTEVGHLVKDVKGP